MVFYIKGKRWRLTQDKKHERLSLKNPIGYSDSKRRVIYLNSDIPDTTKLEILIHELIHAVGRECSMHLLAGKYCDEAVVWELTQAIVQYIYQGTEFYRRSRRILDVIICYLSRKVLKKYGIACDKIQEFCTEYSQLMFSVVFQMF